MRISNWDLKNIEIRDILLLLTEPVINRESVDCWRNRFMDLIKNQVTSFRKSNCKLYCERILQLRFFSEDFREIKRLWFLKVNFQKVGLFLLNFLENKFVWNQAIQWAPRTWSKSEMISLRSRIHSIPFAISWEEGMECGQKKKVIKLDEVRIWEVKRILSKLPKPRNLAPPLVKIFSKFEIRFRILSELF